MRIGSGPPEADAPLIVDADAVLPAPVPPELFEPVARRDAEVVQGHGCVELPQLAEGDSLHLRPQLPDRLSIEQPLRVSIAEGPNHGGMITPRVISGKDGAGVGLTTIRLHWPEGWGGVAGERLSAFGPDATK